MNGKLEVQSIAKALRDRADHLTQFCQGEFSETEIRDLFKSVSDDLVRQANTDIRQAAIDALRVEGLDHKIAAIKRFRSLTGAGLRESKEAIEREEGVAAVE